MPKTAVPTAHGAKYRDRILDAAERLLARYGYRKMTVEDIATEAGIGKGTVYLAFPSKEEVVLGTVDRIVDEVCAEMQQIDSSGRPPLERVRAMLLARILIRFDRVLPYGASLNELLSALRAPLLRRRELHFAREIDLVATALKRGSRAGTLTAGNPRTIARALILATNAFLPYALSPRELGNRRQLHRDASVVVDLLVSSLASTPGAIP